ncbi:MAG: rhomboid family intramembrane serine protease [Opitutales bacterium]|nr:rhomboid family intramembrane serine protease [Opitutales bacterium]
MAWFLILSIACFLIQNLILLLGGQYHYQSLITRWLALSFTSISEGKIWTLLSYAFLHSTGNFFHILFNLLMIFFMGREITRLHGEGSLLRIMVASVISGGLLFVLVHWGSSLPTIGASAAVYGVLALFCMTRPNEPITIYLYFILPITIKPKWLLWIMGGHALFGTIAWEWLGSGNSIAHSAHLGGLIAGIAYYPILTGQLVLPSPFRRRIRVTTVKPDSTGFPKVPRSKRPLAVEYSVNLSGREELRKEVDRILDKITSQGFASLSQVEKDTLDRARDILGKP